MLNIVSYNNYGDFGLGAYSFIVVEYLLYSVTKINRLHCVINILPTSAVAGLTPPIMS